MAATPRMVISKDFTFRGSTKRVANVYHFTGGNLAGVTEFQNLADAIAAAEKAIYRSSVTLVEAVYYDAGATIARFTKTLSIAGTLAGSGFAQMPGQCAALLRWSTSARTVKNHPIYLFKFFRPCYTDSSSTTGDDLSHAMKTALDGYGTAWLTGFSDGTVTHAIAGPNGAAGLVRTTSPNITHRDFPD